MKRTFVILSVFAFIFFNNSLNAQKEVYKNTNPAYTEWAKDRSESFTKSGHALGEIPLPYLINTELPVKLSLHLKDAPASFDLRGTGQLTSVKDQALCGSCWAFATMGSVESRWLFDGRGTYDLSEDNLNTCHPPFIVPPCEGGNTWISSAILTRGSGPYSEADDPYSDTHTSVDCPSGLTPQGIVSSAWFLPTTDPELIKNAIMEYGALATNMYWSDPSYNSVDYTYYYSGSAGTTNHAVTLVGWDDSKVTAGGTGAWIIKNSWGSAWGEGGYFYIAYQDVEVNSTVTLFAEYEDYYGGDLISTYSESGWLGVSFGYGTNAADALVRFVADDDHELNKIGTYATSAGALVSIEIYDEFDGSASLTGLLGSIPTQTCTWVGYHSFDLSSPIALTTGQDYYVKVSYETPGYTYPVPIEVAVTDFTTPVISSGVFWSKSSTGATWYSEDPYANDPCVYAYTGPAATPESLEVTSPDGGEEWEAGSVHDITWTSSGTSGDVHIEYSTNNGSAWTDVIASTPDDGSYSWTIPDDPSASCLVRVSDTDGDPSDVSDGVFTIIHIFQPPVVSDIPDQTVAEGTPFATIALDDYVEDLETPDEDISWGVSGYLNLSVSIVSRVATITPIDPDWNGSETITFTATDNDGGASDSDEATFTVTPVNDPPVVSDIPDQSVTQGTPFATINLDDYVEDPETADEDISWVASGQSELSVSIVSRVVTIAPVDPEWTGSETITFTATDDDGAPLSGSDDATFTVSALPVITVTAPNGGEDWQVGDNHDITWTSANTSGTVHIEYSTDNGGSWSDVIATTADNGTYSWTIPDAPSSLCLIRVSDTDDDPSDVSDAVFTISEAPYITVTAPNGGEEWPALSNQEISWTSAGTSGDVYIEYSTNNGTDWSDVISSTTDDGSFFWRIPHELSTECLVRINDTDGSPADTSDAVFTISEPVGLPADSLALVALYNNTDGDNWSDNTNWLTEPVNTWYGITMESGRVTHISMENNNLAGTIPSEIGNLTSLVELNFNNNQLTGLIPAEIGNLTSLEILSIQSNDLSGSIPPALGNLTGLAALDLQNNQIGGTLPEEIWNCMLLGNISIENNQLSGPIPDDITNLTNLGRLTIHDNHFSDLPDLSPLTGIHTLLIFNNEFTFEDIEPNISVASTTFSYAPQDSVGEKMDTTVFIDDPLCLFANVGGSNNEYQWYLDGGPTNSSTESTPACCYGTVSFNDTGTYICEITNTLATDLTLYTRPMHVSAEYSPSQLDSLALVELYNSTDGDNWTDNSNWLSGPVSSWNGIIVDQNRVIEINLENNHLVGTIPPEIGDLDSLKVLFLPENELSGSIPAEIGSLLSLINLGLGGNQLSGTIPSEIWNLVDLELLGLNLNQLDGSIPPEIGNLIKLWNLNLGPNQLTGPIPAEIGDLGNLVFLHLNDNQLSGSIPVSLCGLSELETLDLYNNQLTGSIPVEIGDLSSLQRLNLRDNQLTGTLPPEIGDLTNLIQMELQFNQLSGSIPNEFGNLTSLEHLDIQDNQLTDITGLSGVISLGHLEMRNNQVNDISPVAGLTNLHFLDIVGNGVTDISPLAGLTNLVALWMHDNQISDISAVSSLSQLQVAHMASNQISDISPLSGLANLTGISLAYNQISDITPLSGLTGLIDLMIEDNQLDDDDLPDLYLLDNMTNDNRKNFGYPDSLYFDLRGNLGFTEAAVQLLADNLDNTDYEYILWNSVADTLAITYTLDAITLDGIADEAVWTGIDPVPMEKIAEGDPITDPLDLSASFKTCWDNDNLYIFVDVQDELLTEIAGNEWEYDNVELYFDMNNSRIVADPGGGGYAYDDNDRQLRFNYNSPDITGINVPEGIMFSQFTYPGEDGYAFEIALPWNSLGIPAGDVGVQFGFQIWAEDRDDGTTRENILSWFAEELDAWRNPSLWGVAELHDELNELPVDPTAIVTYNGIYEPSGNSVFLSDAYYYGPEEYYFEIKNVGQDLLDNINATISGDGYSISAAPASSLYAQESAAFSVQFDQSDPGEHTGSLSITSNDPDSPYTLELIRNNGDLPDTSYLKYTSEPMTIDALPNESIWPTIAAVDISNLILGELDNSDDLSASYKACWNEDNLYILIDVTDEYLFNGHETFWENDFVDIYLDMNNSRGEGYDHDDFQILIPWESSEVYTGSQFPGGLDFAFHTNDLSDGYQFEIAIPWHETGIPASGVGVYFGLDVHVADNDGAGNREAIIAWNSESDDNWWNASLNGVARLMDSNGELPLDPTAMLYYDNYYYPSGYSIDFGINSFDGEISSWYFDIVNIGENELNSIDADVTGDGYTIGLEANSSLGQYERTTFCIDQDPAGPMAMSGTIQIVSNDAASPYLLGITSEEVVNRVIYVSTTGSDETGDGSEGNPYASIQYGVDQSFDGDTIIIENGTYLENVEIHNKNIFVASRFFLTDDPADIETTIIDGNGSGSVISISECHDEIKVVGLTITNGYTEDQGGGLLVHESNIHLKNLTISNNYSGVQGGGALIGNSISLIENVLFENNTCNDGGALHVGFDNSNIINCIFINNHSDYIASAIRANSCEMNIVNSLIANNQGTYCIDYGGAWGSILNSTFAYNEKGLAINDYGVQILNSIVWNNSENITEYLDDVQYSLFEGGIPGTGNLDENPLLYNPYEGDYSLQMGSPCIDAGDPDPSYNDPDGSRNDMGYLGGPGGSSYTYLDGPPVIGNIHILPGHDVMEGEEITIRAEIIDGQTVVSSASMDIEMPDENVIISLDLFDDGAHNDMDPGDNIYGNTWIPTGVADDVYLVDFTATDDNSHTIQVNNALEFILYKPLEIPFTSEAVTIDGIDDESIWAGIPPVPIEKLAFGTVDNEDDLSAWFKACWDLDSLYLFINVTDDSLDNVWVGDWWQLDMVEFYFDMYYDRTTSYDANDSKLGIVWDYADTVFCTKGSDINTNVDFNSFSFTHITNELRNGYQLEIALGFDELIFPVHGMFGFDMVVVDNDAEELRDGGVFWYSSTNENWQDPSVNGTVRLLDFETNIPNEAIAVVNAFPDECGTSNSVITAELFNFGSQTINSFDILYELNGNPISAESAILSIDPGDTVEYVFSTTADLSITGYYDLNLATLLNGGDPHANIPYSETIFVFGDVDPYPDWTTYSTCNGLPSNHTRYVLEDGEGDIWISTWGDGIAKHDPDLESWTVYNTDNSNLSTNNANGLLQYSDGTIWACMDDDDGIVSFFEGSTWTNPNPENIHTLNAFEDSRGDIWFGTWNHGVRKLEMPEGILTTYTHDNSGLAADIAWNSIAEDDEGNIWIGTTSWWGTNDDPGGLCKFDGTSWTVYNTDNSDIPVNGISCMIRDSQGNFWMGHTDNGPGVTKFDGTDWINYNTDNSGIISDFVSYIMEDSRGNLWFATHDGASKFNGSVWQHFNRENSGLLDGVVTISEDSEGNMWFATANGVYKLDGSTLLPDTLDIHYTYESITLDGIDDESIWQSIDPVALENLVMGEVDNPEDFSAWYKACWNLDSLYFFINVTDDILDNSSANNWWENDNVNVFLDMDNSHGESYDENDWQFDFIWDVYNENYCSNPFEGLNFVWHTNDLNDGYQIEIALPLSELGFPLDELIGIDVEAIDNDGQENWEAMLFWNSSEDQNWNNPSYNGFGKLLEYSNNVPPQIIKTISASVPECGGTGSEISVEIANVGSEVITEFDIYYELDGTAISAETVTILLNPGDTIDYTFTTTADLLETKIYNIHVSTLLDGESLYANIPLNTQLLVFGENGSPFEGWKVYSTCNGRSVNRVWNITTDSNGDIWLAAGPAEKLNPETEDWIIYNSENSGISNNMASAILEDHLGNIWVALDEDGAATMYDGSTWTSNNPDNIHVLSMFEDSEHNLWFGTWDLGVRKYDVDADTWENYTVENSGLASNIIFRNSIMEDSQGNMWFGTTGGYGDEGGLCKFDGTNWTVYNTDNSGLPANEIFCSIMDSEGNIWLGFGWSNKGLCKYDGTDWVVYNTGNSGIISDKVNAIFEDNEGNIWCGNDAGISKFNGSCWINYYSGNSGLLDEHVNSIGQDALDNMWFGTENGLYKYNPNYVSPRHFVPIWDGLPGFDHMNFYTLGARIDDIDMEAGDEVGIFDGPYCVGAGTLTGPVSMGSILVILASADDPTTTEIDGFTEGNEITYRLWHAGEGVEIDYVIASYTGGDEVFIGSGSSSVELDGYTTLDQNIDLLEGWNIFSLYVEPPSVAMVDIVQDLIDAGYLVKVQDETGNAIEQVPGTSIWMDYIGDWNSTEGYKIRTNTNTLILVTGTPISLPLTIDLLGGWNIMSYPVPEPQNAMDALDELMVADNLVKVQDESGNAIEQVPGTSIWMDFIGDFSPDEGYKIRVDIADDITFNTPAKEYGEIEIKAGFSAPEHFSPCWKGKGLDHMNLYLDLSESRLLPGDEIAVFDGEYCVGAGSIIDPDMEYLSLVASLDDPVTTEKDGFTEGNRLRLKVWTLRDNREYKLNDPEFLFNTKAYFEKMGSGFIRISSGPTDLNSDVLITTGLGDNYPNPCIQYTVIPFSVGKETNLRITVYDLLGQKVNTLVDGYYEPGAYTVSWNATDHNNENVRPGIYLVKMIADNKTFMNTIELYK